MSGLKKATLILCFTLVIFCIVLSLIGSKGMCFWIGLFLGIGITTTQREDL